MRHDSVQSSRQPRGTCLAILIAFFFLAVSSPTLAQDIEVLAADPSSAEQETAGLVVSIHGNGFDRRSEVAFYVTGTGDQGGIAVRAVAFKGKKRLEATIDVAAAATIADFDVEVVSNGRRGRGTELFRVVEKGTNPSGDGSPLTIELADQPDHNLSSDLDGTGHDNCQSAGACYVHKDDKAFVWTGGMVQPNPPGLLFYTNNGGRVGNGRRLRIDLGDCVDFNDRYPTCAHLPAELLGVIGPDAFLMVRPYGWDDAIPLLGVGQSAAMALRAHLVLGQGPSRERYGIEVASGPFGPGGPACPRTEPGSSFADLAADVTVTAIDVDADGTVDGWTARTGTEDVAAPVPVLICKLGKKADEVADVGTATLSFELTALLIE